MSRLAPACPNLKTRRGVVAAAVTGEAIRVSKGLTAHTNTHIEIGQSEPRPTRGGTKREANADARREGRRRRGAWLTEGCDLDGVELGGGEVCAGDEEEVGDEADAEVARLDGVAEGLEQPGCVVVVGVGAGQAVGGEDREGD